MFTAEERDRLRSELIEYAAGDERISAAAVTGSAAAGREDKWSDIDLAFGIADAVELPAVIADWTTYMYRRHFALHHLDITFGSWLYRVFFLASTLQVDLAVVPAMEFRALSPAFRLIFGHANEPRDVSPLSPEHIIGLAWLHALHARSCIARGKLWQAEYMIGNVRDNALALSCIRHGLPAAQGRGIDMLPGEVLAGFENSLVRRLDAAELARAFRILVQALMNEIRRMDEPLAERLQRALADLAENPNEPA